MQVDGVIISLSYLLSVLIFLNFNSTFLFWFWLEVNILIFLVLLCRDKSYNNEVDIFYQTLYYFIIQSLCSILLLMIFSNEGFLIKNLAIFSLLCVKIRAIPFHAWSFKLCKYLSAKNIFFLLNIQKIPLILFILCYRIELSLVLILINSLGGILLILYRKNFTDFLVSSSLCFLNWLIMIFVWSGLGFILFISKYLAFNAVILRIKKFCGYYDRNLFRRLKFITIVIFLIGLPPFRYFFFKIYIMKFLVNVGRVSMLILIWIFSFVCLISYFNFFLRLLIKNYPLYISFQSLKGLDFLLVLYFLFSVILVS